MSQYTKYSAVGSGGGGSSITSLTGGVTASGPGAATATVVTNANLTGDITSVGNATTLTKVSHTAKLIFVSADTGNDSNLGTLYSPLKTIQAGITKAELIAAFYSQIVINITPSSSTNGYNENLTMSQQGVTLQGYSPSKPDDVIVKGTLTVNLTGTSGGVNYIAASNTVYLKSLTFAANTSSPVISFSGTTFQRLNITDCYVSNNGAGPAISMTNTGVIGTASTITVANTSIYNTSATVPTIQCSAGRYFTSGTTYDIQNTNASGPSIIVDGASATGAYLVLTQATIGGQILVTDNLAIVTMSLCAVTSGSLPGVVTPSSPNTGYVALANVGFTTTATNTITGSGVVALLGGVVKISTGGDIVSTIIQTTINNFPQGAILLGAGSTQNTNTLLTLKNGHLTSQQSTAPTSALQTGAGTTATRTLTRCTDMAGNISITVAGTGIAAGAQLIVTFNKAYATAPVVTLTPANANAALVVGAYVTSSTTTFTINFAAAGTTATAYAFTYHVIET